MRRFPGNKQQAFTALVRPHLDRLYRLAFRLTGTREDAQDLVQDVMLKLYPQVDRLAGIDAPQTWLNRVLYNQFIDDQRRYCARRLRLVSGAELSANPDLAPAEGASTEDLVEGEFTIKRIEAAVARLSDKHRVIISLHDVEGYTLSEIAEITGVSLGTLKSRRHRARERLQEILSNGSDRTSITSRAVRGRENHELRSIPSKPGSVS
ncbi:MAG: RNA polymerase sigma factor [Gammaproteobacteria bacterium]|jgi:RNA polymerase sigma-70 factor (ECF subfamily)|nr:RNA polymerase sigma factor [Gammaproteobacteria bacterium]MDH3749789.1 RNA polymerase sigma factor [Gammaproteobacteria bacterium]MDH3806622.1 RNA polymerase sigma factor [Gammaproteobacteria bacterium]